MEIDIHRIDETRTENDKITKKYANNMHKKLPNGYVVKQNVFPELMKFNINLLH